MFVGDIFIKNPIVMAPMAGISNPSYIKICEEMGASLAFTELLSSEAIVRGNQKTFDMLSGIDTVNIPVGVQIFGSNPSVMGRAAQILCQKFPIQLIDINMGCPVPKVAVRAGAGSFLLKDLDLVYRIVSEVVSSVSVPVSVKIRSGWNRHSINAVDVALCCERAGASLITVHPRTRSQGYSGQADWSVIRDVVEAVSIPIIGNGDVKCPNDVSFMLHDTGCSLVMIGRGILGNPWLIRNSLLFLEGKPLFHVSSIDRVLMCKKHLSYLLKFKTEKEAALEIRSHIAWYLKSVKNSSIIKNKVYQTTDIRDILSILDSFLEVLYEEEEK